MGQRRYEGLVRKPAAFQALTSLTVEEFSELVAPFEAAFREHMAEGVTRTCGSYMGDWKSGGVEGQGGFGDTWRCYPTTYNQEHRHGTQHRGNCTPVAPRL
jgi:hypothetical protein